MLKIMYNPADVGKEVMNGHGKLTKIRKYHMTEAEIKVARSKWLQETSGVNKSIVRRAGKFFFNPYRKGVYYYQIYSMFLLGANKWHSLNSVIKKMEEIMSKIFIMKGGIVITNAWEKFRGKSSRDSATKCKDVIGRVQENMVFFQRLNKLHPTGYKLRQVCSSVDIKRVDKQGLPSGYFSYKLHTYQSVEEALPIRDYEKFKFPLHERRYISYKFIGTVITSNKVVIGGKLHDMSFMQSG